MKVRAHEITYALSKKNGDELFLTEVKTGPSTMSETLRFDAISIKKSWTKPCITGYEVKVSRNDFLHDDKYIHYKNYCNRLYMVCPKGLIQQEEIPDDIGLIYYNTEKKTLFTKRMAHLRDIEINASLLYYILISRLKNDVHPFFNNNRDYIEAYIQDKADKRDLAINFESKLIKNTIQAEGKAKEMEEKLDKYKEKSDERDALVEILKEKGLLSPWEYRNVETLKDNLKRQYPKELYDTVENLDRYLSQIKSIINNAEK